MQKGRPDPDAQRLAHCFAYSVVIIATLVVVNIVAAGLIILWRRVLGF